LRGFFGAAPDLRPKGTNTMRFGNLKLSTKLSLLVAVFLAGFLAFVAVSQHTLETVKVNGPVYRQIVQGKDVIADVLPPPEYIIESYLLLHEMAYETERAKIISLIERGSKLRREYDERHEFWVKDLAEGPLKDAMVNRSYKPAMGFFQVRDSEYVPAILAGDRERAETLLRGPLKDRYEEHRAAVDDVVRMATTANAEYEKSAVEIIASRTSWLVGIACIVVAIVLFIAWVTHRIAQSLAFRLGIASQAAKQVADGDLTKPIEGSANDEAGLLLSSIGTMTKSLSGLVTRVKQSSVSLMSTATQMSATSKQQEATVNGFTASTTEIAAAVKEISATSMELLNTMDEVNGAATRTSELAASGRNGLSDMDSTMRQLERSTGSISSKLAVIREKANDINVVVTTITKVADQTNLLSVNAAIEAEKAGEYGLGFLVVAREIRRLADQSAVATLDIEQMVRHMQSAVSAGVMEMDKFTEEVRRGVSTASVINTQLGQIIEQVQGLSGRIDSVNEGMRSQSLGATQINEAMTQLTEGARQTAASIREFDSATGSLRGAVAGLKEEISRFTVAA
jgi:methyl-accepting chemotaxis protein WspA